MRPPVRTSPWPWAVAAAGYLIVAIALSWPLVLHHDTAVIGFPNVDAIDTLVLRGLVDEVLRSGDGLARGVWYPTGLPVADLVPNRVDHLLASALAAWVPFPSGETVWWLLVLTANGLAGHRLGHQLGGSHAAGLLVGLGWGFSDALLREANLHHAPQSLAFAVPLYFAAWLRALSDEGRVRDAVAAGLWMAVAALSYWYTALFLVVGTLPLLRGALRGWKRVLLAVGVTLALAGPEALDVMARRASLPQPPSAGWAAPEGPRAHVPPIEAVEVDSSVDLRAVLQPGPLDRSNLIPASLLLAALLATRRRRLPWLAVSALGVVMILGPYVTWADRVVLVGDRLLSLPFRWLGELHPAIDRLTWPQRWGLLIPLGLAAVASQGRRPALVAVVVLAETVLRSGNAPLQTHDLATRLPWRALEVTDGAVLALPLRRWERRSDVALQARFHGRPVLNGMQLPPAVLEPESWDAWAEGQPFIGAMKALEDNNAVDVTEEDLARLSAAGVGAITLDVGPEANLTPRRERQVRVLLEPLLGEPVDRGAFLVWWLVPPERELPSLAEPDAWRAQERARIEAFVPPDLAYGLPPLWPKLGEKERSRPKPRRR